ncbi:MAG: FecR domain-containing protein [Porticoccaceae bacterium]
MDDPMKNVVQFPDNAALKNAAAQWLVKLDRGELSSEDRKALNDWLAGGPEHKATLLKMASLWGEMDVAKVLAELFPLPEEVPVQPASAGPNAVEARKYTRAGKSLKMLAAAATVALAVGIAFIAAPVLMERATEGSHEVAEKLYTTSLGEHTVIELADGSQMNLNTQSRARVRFSDGERAIYLEQGEGYFDVAKDAERPFIVYAGNGMVRAVGTAFSIRVTDSSAVDVTLAEGIVEVIAARKANVGQLEGKAHSQQETVEFAVLKQKGETVSYRQSIDELILISEDKLEQRLSWKSGKWLFKGETLAEVIAEASRYTDREIRITDPEISSLQVAGYFDLGDLDPLLEAVEVGLGVSVIRLDGKIIELSGTDRIQRSLTR